MKIGVVGSINIDLVIKTSRIPKRGETLIGESISKFSGGKGANQAVAISRLGESVTIFGCVGKDQYGKYLLENLKSENVNVSHVKEIEEVESGMAIIMVSENDNSISLGAVCPFPLIEAKDVMADLEPGQHLVIDFDCTQGTETIPQWAVEDGHEVTDFHDTGEAAWQITIKKGHVDRDDISSV